MGLKLCWNWQIEDEASKKKTSCDWLFAFLNIFGTEWNDLPYHLFYSYLGLILPLRAEKLVIWQYQSKMSQIRQKCPGGLSKHFCHICNNSRCIHFRIVHFSTLNSTFSTLNNIFSSLKVFLVVWIVFFSTLNSTKDSTLSSKRKVLCRHEMSHELSSPWWLAGNKMLHKWVWKKSCTLPAQSVDVKLLNRLKESRSENPLWQNKCNVLGSKRYFQYF